MPVIRLGHSFTQLGSALYEVELSASLSGLNLRYDMMPSTVLNSPMRLDNRRSVYVLPKELISGIYALYAYDTRTSRWVKVKTYEIYGDKLTVHGTYNDVLVALPADAFEDTYYKDGEYVYQMYVDKVDSRVYRNVTVGSTSYRTSKHIDLLFSFAKSGPWLPSITSPTLFSSFFVKVIVHNIEEVLVAHTVPSELITISCLTC